MRTGDKSSDERSYHLVRGSVLQTDKLFRQQYGDYSVAQAYETTGAASLPGFIFAYDVNCQHCVHFRKRLQNEFLRDSIAVDATILFLIGLFHVHGHKEECLPRFAPTFAPGSGVVAAEILESLWSTLIGVAPSTRNMTSAHRVEVLEACMADSNRKKTLNMRLCSLLVSQFMSLIRSKAGRLIQQHKDAKIGLAEAEKDFEPLNKNVTPEQRASWGALMEQAHAARLAGDVTAMDVYMTKAFKGEIGVKKILLRGLTCCASGTP